MSEDQIDDEHTSTNFLWIDFIFVGTYLFKVICILKFFRQVFECIMC